MKNLTISQRQIAGYEKISFYRTELMGIATLWIMMFHAYELKLNIPGLSFLKENGFAGVDMFIVLSGLGLYCSLQQSQNLRTYFAKRAWRILPMYWCIVGAYSLWLRTQGRISLTIAAWNMSTLYYWFDIPGCFNWYIPALLLFYFLAPATAKILNSIKRKDIFVFLMFPASYFLYRGSMLLDLHYMEDFIYRIPSFAIGLLLGSFVFSKTPLKNSHLTGWSVLAVVGFILGLLKFNKILYISTCYPIAACVVPILCFFVLILEHIQLTWVHQFLNQLGKCSLEIYLINVIITREFLNLSSFFEHDENHILYYIVAYSFNVCLAILLNFWATKVRSHLSGTTGRSSIKEH